MLVHDGATEVGKGLLVEYLGKEVRQVLLCIHIYWCDDVLVTQSLNPLLSTVDMLELGLGHGILGKRNGRRVVDVKRCR